MRRSRSIMAIGERSSNALVDAFDVDLIGEARIAAGAGEDRNRRGAADDVAAAIEPGAAIANIHDVGSCAAACRGERQAGDRIGSARSAGAARLNLDRDEDGLSDRLVAPGLA